MFPGPASAGSFLCLAHFPISRSNGAEISFQKGFLMTVEATQGRISYRSSHDEANQFSIMLDEGGEWLIGLTLNGRLMTSKQETNMRRLVACWNACEGLSTEELDAKSNQASNKASTEVPAGRATEEMALQAGFSNGLGIDGLDELKVFESLVVENLVKYYVIYTSDSGPQNIVFDTDKERQEWCSTQDDSFESYIAVDGHIEQVYTPIIGEEACN
jgi:hypothetical protein